MTMTMTEDFRREQTMEKKLDKKLERTTPPMTGGVGFAVTPSDTLASAQALTAYYADDEIERRVRRLKGEK
jgi:hypothetical protein